MKKKIGCLLIILFVVPLLCGCWDRKEPEELAIVVGYGIDYDPVTEEYKIIVQMVNPLRSQAAGAESASDKPAFWTVSAKDKTIFGAIANLRGKVSREIYYAHTQLELFSTTVLKEVGIIPMLDALERTGQTRPIIIIGATEDDPEELFKVPLPIETINVLGLRSHITITSREKAGTTIEKARMFLNKLTSPGIEPVAVKLSLLEEGGGEAPESEPGPGSKAPVRITGKMIFRGDKLVGDFDLRETRGCNWIIDEVTRANLDFTYPGREDTSVSVINSHNFSTFKPVMTEEGPKIDLKVKATGSIVNITGLSDIKAESELTQSLEKRMATVIQNDIERALDKAQKLKSDVFGFGNAFYRQEYQSWLEMEDDWPDIFADLPVDIEVEAVIKNTGLINRGIQSR